MTERYFRSQIELIQKGLQDVREQLQGVIEANEENRKRLWEEHEKIHQEILKENKEMKEEIEAMKRMLQDIHINTSRVVQTEVRAVSETYLYGHQKCIDQLTNQIADLHRRFPAS